MPGKEDVISGGNQTAAAAHADPFPQAWTALRHDASVQFNLAPQPTPPAPPAWLKAVFEWLGRLFEHFGRFLRWNGSTFPNAANARILLWIVKGDLIQILTLSLSKGGDFFSRTSPIWCRKRALRAPAACA